MTTEITTAQPSMEIRQGQATPAALLIYAMEKGADLDRLEKLMELQTRWDADQARKAYVVDMTEFKKNPPQIVKDKLVGYENKDGSITGYRHATLGAVTEAIIEGLAEHGFSHRWEPKVEGGAITVTCVITHRLGHSETTTLSSGKDESGKKNAIQAMASAVTYLQRYTLLLATGLATHDQSDDDGKAADDISADKLIADAFRARDLVALQALWERGSRVLWSEHGASEDYAYFKAAVNAAKAALTPKTITPGKSSRLSDIVGTTTLEAKPVAVGAAPADDTLPWQDEAGAA